MTTKTKFLTYALGISVCYFIDGIMLEKITRGRYGEEVDENGSAGEKFTYMLALVWIQCLCGLIFAKVQLILNPQKEDTTYQGYYAGCALTYQLAMITSNMALRWVPYPTQVVGKSAKPIFVMILGVLIGRKSYSWIRYVCILPIVTGIVLFMYKENKVANLPETDITRLGELFLFLSLSMDGLTAAIQEIMRSSSAPSAQQMMLAMNWWSTILLGVGLLFSGEGKLFLGFIIKHPELLLHVIVLSLVSALGQIFIFLMIAKFGSLNCSLVTTTRKFFTILCSVVFFENTIIPRQWFGVILVFVGLFANIVYGNRAAPATTGKSLPPKHEEDKKSLIS